MIQYFYSKDLSPTNIKAELDSTLGECDPPFTTIKYLVSGFKQGRTSCQDEHHSSRPNEVTTTKMEKKIDKIILHDRRLKVRKLADMVGISKNAVHGILTGNSDIRKLCARWVPRLLIIKQK